MRNSGFTLIELLVVVTIIVVLLALLVPAMDQAIYQAELAVCMSNQHGVAGGTIAYAAGNKRYYPNRQVAKYGWDHHKLSVGGQPVTNRLDDRPLLRSYMKLNGHLQCPLTATVDLDFPGANTNVYSTYALWFSWRFYQSGTEQGMFKIGDRFTWTEFGQRNRFSLLIGDWDDIQPSTNFVFGNHPSKDGLMSQFSFDDKPSPWIVDPTATVQGNVTLSWWQREGEYRRGLTDLNFGYDDGSVRRFDDVKWDDEKMVHVADFANKTSTSTPPDADRWLKLPRE